MKLLKILGRVCTFCQARRFILYSTANRTSSHQLKYSFKNYSTEASESADKYDLSKFPLDVIRNFSIVAHVDHGKSTLADRILELTGAISKDDSNKQVLDRLQVEKERGITVKAQSASIIHEYKAKKYLLNLIDTPGHVDFSHEVSRSLSACQGVILLIDANQGVQAQTVANFYLAFANDLAVIPVLNKIDLKNASPAMVKEQLSLLFDMDPESVLEVSAKFGTGIKEVLDCIVERIPPPSACDPNASFRAILYDSWYEKFKGVVCQVILHDGCLRIGDQIESCYTGKSYEVKNLAILTPDEHPVKALYAGQCGIFTAAIKKPSEAQVGDTFHLKGASTNPVAAFKPPKPMIYAGIFPMDANDHLALKSSIEKLSLNDSSVHISMESSQALGSGWRLGFLGLLHMDIFSTRLDQEHDMQVVITTPSVPYKVKLKGSKAIKEYGAEEVLINNPARWPDPTVIVETFEPMVKATIISPDRYLGKIKTLCEERRGEQIEVNNLDNERIIISYKLPLSDIIVDFFDHLKNVSSGYASFDYEEAGYESTKLVKLGIRLNDKEVNELSSIVCLQHARKIGRRICLKLCESIPRQQFLIAVQATIGSKVVARENIKPYRKDVTAKLYGGDVTRRQKLLKQQKEGKKRMRLIGNIPIPRDAFIKVLKTN